MTPFARSAAAVRLLFLALAATLLAGCATTRDLPVTSTAATPPVRGALSGMPVAAEGLVADTAAVSGGHHEGIAQVRQPWIWDISAEQRQALYGDLRDVARYAFLDELKRLGLKVSLSPETRAKGGGLQLSGSVRTIELNTFGRGLSGRFEGFGSAGNYWEARVTFADLTVLDAKRQDVLWRGDLTQYAKLPDSPAKLDYTHWDLLSNSLQMGLAGNNPKKLYDAVKGSKADYTLTQPSDQRSNPVELAARLAARDLVARLQQLPRFSTPPR